MRFENVNAEFLPITIAKIIIIEKGDTFNADKIKQLVIDARKQGCTSIDATTEFFWVVFPEHSSYAEKTTLNQLEEKLLSGFMK